MRIEREYQERLDRIRRAAEAGAVAPAERERLETDALRARDEALQRLTRTTTTAVGAEERRIDGLTPGDPVRVHVYQLSALVGRGRRGAAVV